MKGKVAFVLGAAVGYVLGTRAGRERYEQIKRGAKTLWDTPPVQRGVAVVRGAAQTQIERAKDAALQAGKNFVAGAKRDQSAPVDAGTANSTPQAPRKGEGS